MKTIEISEVLKYKNINIIDIRDKNLFATGHIEGAINIPMAELIRDPEKYLKNGVTYYLYCEFGYKSKRICNVLSRLGYDVIDIKDGYYGYEIFESNSNRE